MKTYRNIFYVMMLFLTLGLWSCEEYLDKTPLADINEETIFNNFESYQGYVETMYDDVVDVIHLQTSFGEFNHGDDMVPTRYRGFIEGAYFYVIGSRNWYFYSTQATRTSGTWSSPSTTRNQAYWQNSWFGIRAANITLSKLDQLVDATEEQKKLIEGQAYYFRGYFHWELMKAWGNIPFIDTVFAASSNMNVPQMGLYVTAEKIIKDLQKAAELLPEDWDETETGQRTLGRNWGRATKGMALANLTECLIWCGSPLFHGVEKGSYTYNVDYCKRAADEAWKIIQLANKGVYALEPWATYRNNFMKKNNTFPITKEIILSSPQRGNSRYFTSCFTFGHLGTDAWYSAPPQNYVEYFEADNGLPIDDPAANYDEMNPWENRDPRFRYNILVDRDRQVMKLSDDRAFVQFYIGGRERTAITSLTGFGWRKYWDETLNVHDNGWSQYYFNVPRIRLAEVYLWYAEAVNEAYNGPDKTAPGTSLTAVDAVNIVRARAGMPGVHSKFLNNKEDFRARVWNERAVEIAFENERWYDLRRWHVHHLPQYRELYELQFDKDHTYFNKVLYRTIEFAERHYFLPFPTNQVTLYPEWKQNPGW